MGGRDGGQVFVRLRQRGARLHRASPRRSRWSPAAAIDFNEVCDSREPGSHALGPVLAEALIAMGRLDEAASALEDFAVVVRASGRRSAMASTSRVSGQLAAAQGDWDRAELLFSEAVTAAEELAMPLGSGLAHLAWGASAVRSGKRKSRPENYRRRAKGSRLAAQKPSR